MTFWRIPKAFQQQFEPSVDFELPFSESFDDMLTVTPVLMILIVALGGLLVVIIIVVILVRVRNRPRPRRRGTPPITGLQMKEHDHQPESDGKNPDLIQTHGENPDLIQTR